MSVGAGSGVGVGIVVDRHPGYGKHHHHHHHHRKKRHKVGPFIARCHYPGAMSLSQ
jgi:hypothetical protein